MNTLLGWLGLTEKQVRVALGALFATLAFLVALALLTIGLGLARELWRISADSPFGSAGFATVLVVAAAVGAIVFWRMTRRAGEPPSPTRQLADRFRQETGIRTEAPRKAAASAVRPLRAASAPAAPPPRDQFLRRRNEITRLVRQTEQSGSLAELDEASRLLELLRAEDPDSARWVEATRWEIDKVRARR